MDNFAEMEKRLKKDPRTEKLLSSAAASPEGRRILESDDAKKAEQAVLSGDAAALKSIMGRVLASPEGRALAEKLRRAMEES